MQKQHNNNTYPKTSYILLFYKREIRHSQA